MSNPPPWDPQRFERDMNGIGWIFSTFACIGAAVAVNLPGHFFVAALLAIPVHRLVTRALMGAAGRLPEPYDLPGIIAGWVGPTALLVVLMAVLT